jgi:N-methylhydantoinase B
MAATLDPVTLEVLRNALPAIANEMAADLQRTSYNMMIYEVRDFCTALVNADGELLCQNVGGVSHFVADLGVIITDGMKKHGREGFAPGDVLIMNHQAVAGQHLNNIVIYMPYFFAGELMLFSMVRAHWIDVGGTSTGFGAGRDCPDPWQEGLQFDQLKIYKAGVLDDTLYKMIRDNVRFPESSMGDLRSQIAACRLALRRVDELFQRYGKETMLGAVARIFDETEARCRNIVAGIADGVYEASAFIDDNTPTGLDRIDIHAKVTVKQGSMTIDLSGCAKERSRGLNSRTLAGARIAYKALTQPLAPVNEGSFRALDIVLPEGNIMMARHPLPMTGWSRILPTVVDTVVASLAPAMPNGIPAAHHGVMGGGSIIFAGVDPKTKRRFVTQSIEGAGWGGRPTEDGESGSVSICQGDVRNGSIEGMEMKVPILIEKRGFRPDSGGAGKYRGGLGLEVHSRGFIDGRWNLEQSDRRNCLPWGLWGGGKGTCSESSVKKPGENDFRPMHGFRTPLPADTEVFMRTGGGGGWGDPLDRDIDRVQNDVREGFVSHEAAAQLYGVIVREDFSVDAAATTAKRAAIKAERNPIERGAVNSALV